VPRDKEENRRRSLRISGRLRRRVGEIQFDFENGTAEIIRLAEWDTMVSKVFAERVMKHIRVRDADNLQKKLLFAF